MKKIKLAFGKAGLEIELPSAATVIVVEPTFVPGLADPTQVCLGTTMRGHETWVNRELVECDVKILTGFIEPHLFAGFSGGGKAIMPGMAGQKTILGNHDARMIANLKSTWGETRGNPIWEEVRSGAKDEPHFSRERHAQQAQGNYAGVRGKPGRRT